VRELPWENIGSEKGCLRTENASSLSHGPNQRRKWSNYSADESVPWSGLLHWKVHAEVADPDCIRNDPGIRCELAVSQKWSNWESGPNETSILWTDWAFGNRPILCPDHDSIFVCLLHLTEALCGHGYSLSCKQKGQRWQEPNWC
jgi:hypothetical protein